MAQKSQFLYNRRNYWLLLFAVVLIVSGYLLMTGQGNEGGSEFNREIYSFRRITLAPVIILIGYAAVAVVIMWNPRKKRIERKSHDGKI